MALKKVLNPTYEATVGIPVPGGDLEKCGFTFKYLLEDDYEAKRKEYVTRPVCEFLVLLIEDWNEAHFAEFGAYSPDALKAVCNVYPGAPSAILESFLRSRHQGRLGN